MKYLLTILLALFATGYFILPAQASSLTTTVDNSIQVYQDDFDVMALDFVLAVDDQDTLTALTISLAGSARYNIEFYNLKLWADRGEAGFQGWGYDELVSIASQEGGVFVFKNLAHAITQSEHFYVSLDTGLNFSEKTGQFIIDQPKDTNGDGMWQVNETGIFLENEGVITEYNGQSFTRTIFFRDAFNDGLGPKGTFTDMSIDPDDPTLIIDPDLPITFMGEARDRNAGQVKQVDLIINDVVHKANSSIANQTSWEYEYTPASTLETLIMKISLLDTASNLYVTKPRYAILDTRMPNKEKTSMVISNTPVKANGSDMLEVGVILRDGISQVLRGRNLDVIIHKNGANKTTSEVTTNTSGEVTLSNTFTESGTYMVDLYHRNILLKSQEVVILASDTVITPNPEPVPPQMTEIHVGDLIKASQDAVYYYSSLGKRHVFLSQPIYASWYGSDFSAVRTITDAELAAIPLGDSVAYRPGTMLTAPSINEVYLVTPGRVLRHITTEAIAAEYFGQQWNTLIHDTSESLLFLYTIGDPIVTSSSVNVSQILSSPMTIDAQFTAL